MWVSGQRRNTHTHTHTQVDGLAAALLLMINAPFRESVEAVSEVECQHVLLAVCSCLTLCIRSAISYDRMCPRTVGCVFLL